MTGIFSDRNGYRREEPEISVREDAPEAIRVGLIMLAYRGELSPEGLRRIICDALLRRPDPNNWGESNVRREIDGLIDSIEWFKVYDIAESVFEFLHRPPHHDGRADNFEYQLNLLFREHGVGWQMQDGKVLARGSEGFSQSSSAAIVAMQNAGNSTATNEMREALADISRRPQADITGAIQHAMAALECVARNVSKSKGTLGEIIPKLDLPKPLDEALRKLWGFTSERGRHVHEGREPLFEEAELVVTIASAVCTYLIRTNKTAV